MSDTTDREHSAHERVEETRDDYANTAPAADTTDESDTAETRLLPESRPEPAVATRDEVVAREAAEFGGFKWGSAFFGWLTATGMAVLLVAILSAIGAGVGLGTNGGNANNAANAASDNAATVGLIGAIALAVIMFIAYFCGGYVAGRMARFAGAKQGFAVWLWAVFFAIVGAIIAWVAGSQYNVLSRVNSFPRIPIDEGTLTTTGIITAIALAVLSLVGALLGGLAGMRYHRVVDRVGLGV